MNLSAGDEVGPTRGSVKAIVGFVDRLVADTPDPQKGVTYKACYRESVSVVLEMSVCTPYNGIRKALEAVFSPIRTMG